MLIDLLFLCLFAMHLAAATITLLALTKTALSIDTVEAFGNKLFFSSNGSQFYIRGLAYQKDTSGLTTNAKFVDPLTDEKSCRRDIPYLQLLNTNVIRVYALNFSQSHDACMKLLEQAGIYVIADLSSPDESIISTNPSWNLDLYDRYTSVIDEMQQYDNVLGFFAGNEVITNSSTSSAAAFVKAAIRDTKQYMTDQGYRDIPVGYSANDDSDTRVASADYFACGKEDIHADFYGINMYEWCGSSSFSASGYKARTEEFSNLTIPVFFSEYGCNEVQPRKFTEVKALFSDEMTDVWSGGIVYMYFEEANNYGLVSIDGDTVSTMDDFPYYSSEINAVSPTFAWLSDASASCTSSIACPTSSSDWSAATKLPPTPQKKVCKCLEQTLRCVVSNDVHEKDYGDLFGVICGVTNCADITANGTSGSYGAYSYCSPKEKLSYILNQYYEDQNRNKKACDFSGSASLVSTASLSGSCSSVLSAASASADLPESSTRFSSSSTSSSSLRNAACRVTPGVGVIQIYFVTLLVVFSIGSVSLVML
ncbi:hypothetical protein FOA43_004162 [Brettanomyces nanus]|uniref:1,3-beta-glucanosyltransferase n=1 Tax=Eeniella nana TaxID=13502 RepID=A0A875S737_EENNA|nr:uncharacterized protein FOA43_004162 [Brettanomyces nanus]QPG76768.1 hypothetical protein FOA43_004162 [Brettanomyces nanus]